MAIFSFSKDAGTAQATGGSIFGNFGEPDQEKKKAIRAERIRLQAEAAKKQKKPTQKEDKRGFLSKAFDQVNPLDSGRSFKTATPDADEAKKSIVTQLGETVGTSYKRTGEAVGETLFSGVDQGKSAVDFEVGQNVLQGVIDKADKRLQDRSLDPALRDRITKLRAETIKSRDKLYGSNLERTNEVIERTDPVKGAAAIGSVGFDLLTAGTVGGATQTAGRAGVKQVARQVATGAGQGAVAGGLGAVEQRGGDVTLADIARGAGTGAVLGGGLVAGGAALGAGSRRILDDKAAMAGAGDLASEVPTTGQRQLTAGSPQPVQTAGGSGGVMQTNPPSQADLKRLTTIQNKIKKAQQGGGVTVSDARALMKEQSEVLERIQNPVARNSVAVTALDDQIADATNKGDIKTVKQLEAQRTYAAEEVYRAEKSAEIDTLLAKPGDSRPLQGDQKASGQALTTEANAIDKDLLDRGVDNIATYGTTTWGSQGQAATKIVDADYDAAVRIALGQQEPPDGVLVNAVYKAVEDKAIKTGDIDMIEKLVSTSAVAPRTSRYAQELGILGAKDPNSPVTALESVLKARKQATPDIPVAISREETVKMTDLAGKLEAARTAAMEGGDKAAYGKAKVDFDNYVADLVAEAKPELRKALKNPNFYKDTALKLLGASKSAVATLDNSVIGRQGWKTLMTSPKTWAKNSLKSFDDMLKTYRGKEVLDFVHADVVSRDNALNGMYTKMKLDVYGAKKDFLEEAFPVSLGQITKSKAGKFVLRPFKASEVSFSAWQQRTRADLADQYLRLAQNNGVDLTKKSEVEAIGKLVNSLTGRGNLGKGERVADTFNKVFFAPRLVKSHVDVLGGHIITGAGGSNFVRKQAAKNLLKIAVGSATALQLASAVTGGKVETDPRSSNFGKLQIGDTRFDLTGGMAGLLTLGSRLITDSTKSSVTGEVRDLNTGEFGSQNTSDVLLAFGENKLSPAFRAAVDWKKGEDFDGNKPTIKSTITNLTVPLIIRQYGELKNAKNPANIYAAMIAEGLGVSANTYGMTSNWNANNGKKVTAFKEKVSKETFEKANEDFDNRFSDWYDKVSVNSKFWKLPVDKRETLVTNKKNDLTTEVMQDNGFKYKNQKPDNSTKALVDELSKL